jgi:hypothetical protein
MPDPTQTAVAQHVAEARRHLEPWPPTAGQLVADIQKRIIFAQGEVLLAQLAILEAAATPTQTEPGS